MFTIRKEMTPANEAMMVPRPPIFTPINNGRQFFEKLDNKIVAGTLLIN